MWCSGREESTTANGFSVDHLRPRWCDCTWWRVSLRREPPRVAGEPWVLEPPRCPHDRGRQVPVDQDRAAASDLSQPRRRSRFLLADGEGVMGGTGRSVGHRLLTKELCEIPSARRLRQRRDE